MIFWRLIFSKSCDYDHFLGHVASSQ